MHVSLRVLAVTAAATLALSACSGPDQQTSPSSAASPGAQAAGPKVIAAFYPLEWASTQVLGDRGGVTTLTSPGTEAHDLELTPQQIASLPKADLVVYVKGFQPAVDKAIEQSGAKALEVGSLVGLEKSDDHDHEHEGDDHDHETGHGDHDSASPSADDHGSHDPHFWQDPARMVKLVDTLAKRLGETDQEGMSSYAANAKTTSQELTKLDNEFSAGLKQCKRKEFITTHTAFNYLAHRYGVEEIGIAGISPDAEPSTARVKEIHKEAKAHGVTTIFFETLTSDAVAKAIAGDLGLKTAVLDPLEGITDKSPGKDYPSIMRANLAALRMANECS